MSASPKRYNIGSYFVQIWDETDSVCCSFCSYKSLLTKDRNWIGHEEGRNMYALCHKCLIKYNLNSSDEQKRKVGFAIFKIKFGKVLK